MLNILAITEKKKILTEYRLRLATVVFFGLAMLILASVVLLLPSYLLASAKYSSAENQFAKLEEVYGKGGQEKEITAQISDVNSKVKLLLGADVGTRLLPSEEIANILEIKVPAIKISGLTYEVIGAQERITMTGTALDRDSLATFFDNLKKDPTFTSVTLPISSYVKSVNIDFSIVAERKPKTVPKK
ncbi:MAG: PilN domain-containing protein [Minisyncoccia bacterium]